jgi:hypothetical protein
MRSWRRTLWGALLGILIDFMVAGPANALEVGQKAPDFTLTAPGNKPVKLADLLRKGPMVLYTFLDTFSAA